LRESCQESPIGLLDCVYVFVDAGADAVDFPGAEDLVGTGLLADLLEAEGKEFGLGAPDVAVLHRLQRLEVIGVLEGDLEGIYRNSEVGRQQLRHCLTVLTHRYQLIIITLLIADGSESKEKGWFKIIYIE